MALVNTWPINRIQGPAGIAPVASFKSPYTLAVRFQTLTNLWTNPTANLDPTGFNSIGGATVTRTTAESWAGAGCIDVQVTTTDNAGIDSSTIACSINTTYTLIVGIKLVSGSGSISLGLVGNISGATEETITASTTYGVKRFAMKKTTNGTDSTLKFQVLTNGAVTTQFRVMSVDILQGDYTTSIPLHVNGNLFGCRFSDPNLPDASTSICDPGLWVTDSGDALAYDFGLLRDGGFAGVNRTNNTEGGGTNNVASATTVFDHSYIGYRPTQVLTFGSQFEKHGIVYIENLAAGLAAWIKSSTTTDAGEVHDFPSLTSGVGIGLYGPSDLTTMVSSLGSFLKFAAKTGSSRWDMKVEKSVWGSVVDPWFFRHVMYGGGLNTRTTTTGTSTFSTTGTTVTGSGTANFIPEIEPTTSAPAILFDGTNYRLVESVSTDNAAVLNAAFPANVPAGTAVKTANAQYAPPLVVFEGPNGDHLATGKADELFSLWVAGDRRLKMLKGARVAGTGTLSATSGTTTFTTSSANAGIAAGDVIIPVGHKPIRVARINTTSDFRTYTKFVSTLTTVSFVYIKAGTELTPTGDEDTRTVNFPHIVHRETSSTGPSGTLTETSLYNSFTVDGGMLGTIGVLVAELSGTGSVTNVTTDLKLRVKLGATTVLTNTTNEVVGNTSTFYWDMRVELWNNASASAQNGFFVFTARRDGSAIASFVIRIDGTSTVDTTFDNLLDITADFGVAGLGTLTATKKRVTIL